MPAGREPTARDSRQGILTRTTPADRGLVRLPVLTPHLEFRDLGEQQTLLVSESFNTLLHGELYRALLPLLDGRHPYDEIVAAVGETHSAVDVPRRRGFAVRQGLRRLRRSRAGPAPGGLLVVPGRIATLGRAAAGGVAHRR